jgi:hypothetical protein
LGKEGQAKQDHNKGQQGAAIGIIHDAEIECHDQHADENHCNTE